MTRDERNEIISKAIKEKTEKLISEGPEACKKYLIELGIFNEDGTLHKDFGG